MRSYNGAWLFVCLMVVCSQVHGDDSDGHNGGGGDEDAGDVTTLDDHPTQQQQQANDSTIARQQWINRQRLL